MVGYVECHSCGNQVAVEYEEHRENEDIEDSCEHCGNYFKYQWEKDINLWIVNNG